MGDTSSYRRQAGQEVIDIVCKARNKAYGDAEDNFANIAEVMTTILRAKLKEGERITAVDVSALSVAIKVGRLATDVNHEDSWLDLAGYALCALGIIRADRARGYVPSHSKDVPLPARALQAEIDEAFKLLDKEEPSVRRVPRSGNVVVPQPPEVPDAVKQWDETHIRRL
jgi:hypothetical protein